MIEVRNITKRFPTVTALDSISLNVRDGEFFGLLGPNGAGKSTLMNLLIGYLDPDAGEILIRGERVTRDSLETRRISRRRRLGRSAKPCRGRIQLPGRMGDLAAFRGSQRRGIARLADLLNCLTASDVTVECTIPGGHRPERRLSPRGFCSLTIR